MPAYDDDLPTMREMYRTLCDFRDEWRTEKQTLVRKDVHSVEHENLIARIAAVEASFQSSRAEQAAARVALKNQFYGMWFAVAGAVMTALIVAWVK